MERSSVRTMASLIFKTLEHFSKRLSFPVLSLDIAAKHGGCRQLTKSILKTKFGLKIDLPPDRLCPPVSLRLI